MKKQTKVQEIFEALKDLEIGQSVSKQKLIEKMYNDYNYFIVLSFNVLFYKAKKLLVSKGFKSDMDLITRTY